MVILCPACSSPQQPVAINIEEETRSCYCPSCRRRYWVETITINQTNETRIDSKWATYLIKGDNNVGRQIQESFAAQARLPLRETGTVTIVKRGQSIVGIADQNNNAWVTLQPQPQPKSPWRSLFSFLAIISCVLAGFLIVSLADLVKTVAESYGLVTVITACLVCLSVLLAPLLVRVVQIARGKDDLV